MKLLLDECTPRRLKRHFTEHATFSVEDAGLKGLKNGDLLKAASGKFDVLITVDRKLSHEQNINKFNIAVLVLVARSNSYEHLMPLIPLALDKLKSIKSGEVVEVRA